MDASWCRKRIEKCTKMVKYPHLLYMLGGDQDNSCIFLVWNKHSLIKKFFKYFIRRNRPREIQRKRTVRQREMVGGGPHWDLTLRSDLERQLSKNWAFLRRERPGGRNRNWGVRVTAGRLGKLEAVNKREPEKFRVESLATLLLAGLRCSQKTLYRRASTWQAPSGCVWGGSRL